MPSEVENLFVSSSEIYYNYLAETNKGLIVFDVLALARILKPDSKKVLYRLRLDKKISSTESLSVQVLDKIYLPNQVKVIFWDEDKKDLTIQIVTKSAKEELNNLAEIAMTEVKVIVDLKFLVKRVGDWFKTYDCSIPTKANDLRQIKMYNACSNTQRMAVEFCLSEPFSYVWGAPGTGKTKYVLANAVLNCYYNGKRAIVVAPTNNAIEQVLVGLIEQFDSLGIDRNNILRLGSPSKHFAESYPEICEIKGISQIVAEINKQKDLLTKILAYKKDLTEFDEYKQSLKLTVTGKLPELVKSMLKEMDLAHAEKAKIYSEYSGEDISAIEERIAELAAKIEENDSRTVESRINKRQIIGCTIDGFIGYFCPMYNGEDTPALAADHIFLDEAGYCSLAKAATLFSANIPVTFFGDHFQLPPVCEMDDDLIADEDNQSVFVWSQSALYLAELLADGIENGYEKYMGKQPPSFENMPKIDLATTYRFGQNLLDILCKNVYKTELFSTDTKENIIVECIDAPRITTPDKKRENLDEALAIKRYVQKNAANLGSVAVLCPYKNQLALIRKNCFKFLHDSIFTIHGSQGKEWDTVIISVTDTTNKYFVDSNNLRANGKLILNTAISRVKKRLVIVCDKEYWLSQKGQLISEIIRLAK